MANELASVCPYYEGLRFPGVDGKEPPSIHTEEIANRLIGQVHEIRPEGPYALCGFSFGGIVAYEMARQMWDQGNDIETLILWDASTWESECQRRRPLWESVAECRKRFAVLSTSQRI